MKLKRYILEPVKIESHPARGAWIETCPSEIQHAPFMVAPREGCVD